MVWYGMACYGMLCYAMICYVTLCCVVLCCVVLCYVMLCYVMIGDLRRDAHAPGSLRGALGEGAAALAVGAGRGAHAARESLG